MNILPVIISDSDKCGFTSILLPTIRIGIEFKSLSSNNKCNSFFDSAKFSFCINNMYYIVSHINQ